MFNSLQIDKVHSEHMLQQLWRKKEAGVLCDIVLIAGIEEKRISAHRCVISSASEYFNTMFMSTLNESKAKEVKIPSVNGDILQNLVKYCYTGYAAIDEDCVVELLKTAHMLLMPKVVMDCADFLLEQLDASNCLGFAKLAEEYNCEMLLQKSQDYSLRNFMQVRETVEFLELNVEQLSQLLASDELYASTEEDVFLSVRTWLNHDRNEREKYQAELLKLVRLSLLDETFLAEHVRPLCTSSECLQIYTDAVERPDEETSAKPRKSKQFLFSITFNIIHDKMYVYYYCQQQRLWLQALVDLNSHGDCSFTVMDDDVYLIGGEVGRDAARIATNAVICLNLKTLSSKSVNPMKERRKLCGAAVFNRCIYAVGGYCDSNSLSSAEKWNSRTNTWSDVAPMAVSRGNFGIATLKNKLYVVGGINYEDDRRNELHSVECYDPLENIWTTCAPMPWDCINPKVTAANGKLYVVSDKGAFKSFQHYDPATNTWTLLCSLSEKSSYFHLVTSFQNKIIAIYSEFVEEYSVDTDEWKINKSIRGLRQFGHMFTCLVNSYVMYRMDRYSMYHGNNVRRLMREAMQERNVT